MVAFEKLFLATALLIGSVAAVPALQDTALNVLEERDLEAGTDPNRVRERQYVNLMQIKNNCGSATIVDLTGCTALFFYMGTTLQRAVHIAGDQDNQRADAKNAAYAAGGSDSVTIAAANQKNYDAVVAGVKQGNSALTINPHVLYTTVSGPMQ
nr:hypothetical protein CFP56_21242 [Quercus suber]